MNYKDYIKEVQDFPVEGVNFKDISPLLGNRKVFKKAVDDILKIKDLELKIVDQKINEINKNLKNLSSYENKNNWSLGIGLYPGILFGMRTYDEPTQIVYVFYIPFIDLSLEIYK